MKTKTMEWIYGDPIGHNELQSIWPRLVAVICHVLPELPEGFEEQFQHSKNGRPLQKPDAGSVLHLLDIVDRGIDANPQPGTPEFQARKALEALGIMLMEYLP